LQDQELGRPSRGGEGAESRRRDADRGRRRRQVAAALLLDASRGPPWRQAGVRGGTEGPERRLRRRGVPEIRRAVQATGRSAAIPERLPRLQEPAGGRLLR